MELVLGLRYLFVAEPVYKRAIKEDALIKSNAQYVLCERAQTTGYDWFAKQEGSGEWINANCRITGQNPLDVGFQDQYLIGNNVFVMYWDHKRTYRSEALQIDIVEYEVTDWTVLAPVKRNFPSNLFKPENYIVKSDVKAAI